MTVGSATLGVPDDRGGDCHLYWLGGDSGVSFLLWGMLGPNYQDAMGSLA